MSAATTQPNLPHGRAFSLAWLVLVACILAVFLALVPLNLRDISRDWQVVASYPALFLPAPLKAYALYVAALRYGVALVFFATAAVIFWHKSADRMALFTSLVLVLLPLSFGLGGFSETWDLYGLPWRRVFETTRQILSTLGLFGFVTLFFLFPDGHFVPRWTRWVAWGGWALALLPAAAAGPLVQAYGLDGALVQNWICSVWTVTLAVLSSSAVAAQFYRYRRVSTPVQRQQTRLVVFGFATALAGFILSLSLGLIVNARFAALYMLVLMHLDLVFLVLIPLTIAVSILRYRLWDIDLIVNRTLVYGALTVIVLGLYGLVVGVLGALFQVGDNLWLSILATGLIAILFQPVRQRLQREINRLMYGERDDPVTVLSRLGQRLQTAIAPEAVLSTMAETVAQALKLPYAAIALKEEEDDFKVVAAYRLEASHPRAAGRPAAPEGTPAIHIPLVYQSETIGYLIVAPRSPGEALTPADHRLLDEIAHQAGVSAHAARLTAALQHSRERLVTTREEERRRLRRDLHDGLGPTLASQAFKLDAALDLLDTNPAAVHKLLADLKAQTQATVTDIRRLVYELRPPALDELGLVSAIQEQAARFGASDRLRVVVDAPAQGLPALSAAVEVAAYRIVLEALTNVARHAQARQCRVRLALSSDGEPGHPAARRHLQIEVIDDGLGLPAQHRAGVGLTSLRERAAELGGTCVIEAGPSGGTRVLARLPLGEGRKTNNERLMTDEA